MAAVDIAEIPVFGRQFLGTGPTISRIGNGALGGKASGLFRVQQTVLRALDGAVPAQIEITIPTLTVLGTDLFDSFMDQNDLYPLALSDLPDDRIALAFQQATLPPWYLGDLRALIEQVRTPLAVRSSSLLEDDLDHPFAGVYATKMIPNNQPDNDSRFQRLVEAIKFVYASTFFRQAKQYIRSIGKDLDTEKMAVIIQEVVGQRCGDRFYPGLSGVARSYNYYPSGHAVPEDGVVNLALGLGKQIVDGGLSWKYSPPYPQAPPPYGDVGDLLKNSQTEFWAVNMGAPPLPDPIHETEYLVRGDLKDAEYDGTLEHLVSTFDVRSDRLRPGLVGKGPRVLDFAPVLQFGTIPLNTVIERLLPLAEQSVGAAVEIEFAMTLKPGSGDVLRFGFLQMRPMLVSDQEVEVSPEELIDERNVLASETVLGNGVRESIRDVIFLKPDVFDARHSRTIASEIEQFNHALTEANRPYLLIGFGRWGSSDPWLGVPVEWSQISGARVIVESSLPDMNPDLSQGSHFFHNLTSFQVLYLSSKHNSKYPIDWQWLDQQQLVAESTFVKHVQIPNALTVRVDGRHRRGVIKHAE